MWKVDNYSSQPSAHWAFVGSMCKLVQWDYHLFFFFQLGDPQVNCTLLWQQQVIQKSSPKQDKDRTCQTRRLHFRTPHWVHTNSSTVVSWDSQTVKLNGWLFFSLALSLSAALYHGLLLSENTFTLGFMTPSSPGFTATSLGFHPIVLCSLTSPLGRYAGHGPKLYFLLNPHSQMRNLFQVHGFS